MFHLSILNYYTSLTNISYNDCIYIYFTKNNIYKQLMSNKTDTLELG